MSVTYCWRPGSRISIDAQRAGREIERLRKVHSGLTAEQLLDASRSHNAVLHGAFEWDDSKAAEAYRVNQAGHILRCIDVDVTHSNVEPTKQIRAFISVEQNGERKYQSLEVVMSDKELQQQAIQRAFAQLVAWRERHAELVEFAKIFSAIDEARPAQG